ncbi:MAG: glycosyltransferase, partial [Caldilineae bacterium]
QTYKMGFSCITLGRWLTKRLREWYNADADYFDLAVDHNIYYPRPVEKSDHPRICFYARPSTPRRLFPLGIEALERVHRRRPDVEILFYGAQDADLPRSIPFPYTNRGILTEDQLAELFSACEVGIVLSPTNCSLVPPEMMACRCAVVDLNRETVMGVLEHEVNALLAEPTPDAIAGAVLRLLEDEPLRQRLVETAYRQAQERSWQKSARKVEAILRRKLPSTRRARAPHRFETPSNLPTLNDFPEDQQRRLNAIHAARRRLWSRGKTLLKTWLNRLRFADRNIVLNGAPVQTLGELAGRRRIGQRFIARRDGLCGVEVLVSTYGRRNTRDVCFRLKESPTSASDLAVVRVNASLLSDRGYVRFAFAPQSDSGGKSYYFCIESPESVPGDAITLWAYSNADVPDAPFDRNGRAGRGHLVFGLCYRDAETGIEEERPLLDGWGRRVTLWGRMKKGVRVLASQGPKGLQREVVNYWKWKTGRV